MAGTVWDRLLKLEEAAARRQGRTFNALGSSSPGFWRREGSDPAVAPAVPSVGNAPYQNWRPQPLPPGGADGKDGPGWTPPAPPGVSLEANIAEAQQHKGDLIWFYNQVKNGGPWDYKKQSDAKKSPYENFGNWHYGVVGRAAGIPAEALTRMAGWNQTQGGNADPKFGSPYGGYPHGDDPWDQVMIKDGISWEDRRRGM